MKLTSLFCIAVFFSMPSAFSVAESIDLSGDYRLALEEKSGLLIPDGETVTDPQSLEFKDRITLPNSTDLAKKGPRVTEPVDFEYHLSREYNFIGPAYFSRSITIPEDWKGDEAQLFLERVMWQSRVWVDGKEVGSPQDSLSTPHLHKLGKLSPGEHQLVIRVDNRMIHPIGDKGHGYGAQTQSLWNGIVGKMELRRVPANHIDRIRVFPELDGRLKVEVRGKLTPHPTSTAIIKAIVRDPENATTVKAAPFASTQVKKGKDGQFTVTLEGKAPFIPVPWSEFTPKLYELSVTLVEDAQPMDTRSTTFGFRDITRMGNQLLLNGKPAFMRGNLECAVFPKTGHPPVTVEEWKAVWQVYKDHNLNHARFHSWCPPEAALIAADEMGIYLQVETPIWIDHWMTKPNPRPEMNTLAHPQGIGKGDRSIDEFTLAEMRRILDAYGNHPSFTFFCFGNELGTSNFKVAGKWIRQAKEDDPRRLYSVSTARTITPHCDFNATHNIPGVGWCRQRLRFGTNWDYEADRYSRSKVPIIAHEIGQWPVYPDWEAELPRYSGPLKPYRLEKMREQAQQNGIHPKRTARYHAASGAINALLYRDEIESFLRTPSCRGFQLLGMQDFSGQGEAHVGWLDSFYTSKGTTDLKQFRHYCAPTVPLLKLPKYIFSRNERPQVTALLHHYGAQDLKGAALQWTLRDTSGRSLDSGTLAAKDHPAGSVLPAGSFTLDLTKTPEQAQRFQLTVSLPAEKLYNDYSLWVYPEQAPAVQAEDVLITADWDGEAKAALAEGKKVLLLAHGLGGKAAAKLSSWRPLYWSVPFFPGQNRDTIGLSLRKEHPAFSLFPTSSFGDWNWYRLCEGSHGFDLSELTPADYEPIAEPVTDFHLNRRLGSLFELKVGSGSLLVCGYDLSEKRAKRLPEVAHLRASILHYTASSRFQPKESVTPEELDKLFEDHEVKMIPAPKGFENAELYVKAATKLPTSGKAIPWQQKHDQIIRQADGVGYAITGASSWKDKTGSAWAGKEITITIKPRPGVAGKILLRVHDWNKLNRTGTISFEGQAAKQLGKHHRGAWLEFQAIREDSNDGELSLKINTTKGPNLMVTDLAFIPDDDQ